MRSVYRSVRGFITKRTKTSWKQWCLIIYWWSWIHLHVIDEYYVSTFHWLISSNVSFYRPNEWFQNHWKKTEAWKKNVWKCCLGNFMFPSFIVHIFHLFECFESVLFVLRPVSCASSVCMLSTFKSEQCIWIAYVNSKWNAINNNEQIATKLFIDVSCVRCNIYGYWIHWNLVLRRSFWCLPSRILEFETFRLHLFLILRSISSPTGSVSFHNQFLE